MNRNKLEVKHIVLIVLLLLTIFLAIFNLLVDDNRKLTPVEIVIKDAVVVVQKVIYSPFRYLDHTVHKYKGFQSVYKENENLRKEIDKYSLLKGQYDELKKENEALKELLKINQSLSEYTYLNATVVNRNVGYWYNSITIDKGSHHGVTEDMAVINSHGLVGKITKVTNFSSEVKLITTDDLNSKISVGIDIGGKVIHGLLSGYDNINKLLIIDGVVENAAFNKGNMVYTTGFGGIFPSGIIVGTVDNTIEDQYGLSKNILVKSDVDFNDLYFVTILKRKVD
jgi:rod shape-determining protein MreC